MALVLHLILAVALQHMQDHSVPIQFVTELPQHLQVCAADMGHVLHRMYVLAQQTMLVPTAT